MSEDLWFDRLAEASGGEPQERAPASLKSKVYSALVARMSESGSLVDLRDTREAGGHLCVFEHVLTVLPVGANIRSMSPCRICHARLLGERMEQAPIFWPACPYSDFHRG